jgi:tetratricopeptide (TPR) repeat protein
MTKQQEAFDSSSGEGFRSSRAGLSLVLVFVVLLTASLGASAARADSGGASSSLQVETFKTHSRLSISLDPSVDTQWKETPAGFSLLLKGLRLQDLYLGATDLESLHDSRIKEVKAVETDAGIRIDGKWNFPTGANAIAHPKMERFTYREKNPARFIVDFWPKGGPTVAEVKRETAAKAKQASIAKAEAAAKKRKARRIAAEQAVAIESDVARFCKEPLREGVDLFLEFIPEHEPPSLAAFLPTGQPDEGYPFIPPKTGAPDAKYVRLALDLYGKHDYALAARTVDFLIKEQPKSINRVDMEFLKANALLRLGMKTQAAAAFDAIRETHPGTPAALASALYLAEKMRKSGNELQTIERYLWIATEYPKHRNVWAWRLLAAEALYRIKQTDRAVHEYEWVAAHAPEKNERAMASLRIGDAYLYRSQYDRALAAYFRAAQKFPSESANLPSAQINRGEALYWLGQLDRAESQFRDFLKRFPGHPAGWRALLRDAEIEGRRPGADAIAKSRAGFLATVNEYPFSPGAVIARMRLVPCGDHGGFDAKTAADFFKRQTENFDGKGAIRMERFGEFRSMIRVRSMILLNDPVAALDAALQERDDVSRKSGAYAWLGDMERKLFRKEVVSLLDAGKKFEAVRFYDKYASRANLSETLPDDVTPERVALSDPDYLLRLSRVAAELGLGRTAETIAKRYDQESKNLGVGRALASGGESLESRLRSSERAFTDAKALWVVHLGSLEKNTPKDAAAIRKKLAKVADESPFAYQKEIILGIMAERAKSYASAILHASKASMLLAKLTHEGSVERIALDQWIATLQTQAGNTRVAIECYRKLELANPAPGAHAKAEGVGLKPITSKTDWILAEGELAAKLGKYGEAAAAYGRAVDAGLGGNRALYQYAVSLEKIGGDDAKVNGLLKQIAGSKENDFWKELARKKLAGADAMEGNAL